MAGQVEREKWTGSRGGNLGGFPRAPGERETQKDGTEAKNI